MWNERYGGEIMNRNEWELYYDEIRILVWDRRFVKSFTG